MYFNDRERIIALTPQWKGERLPDGRPKVEDKYLDARTHRSNSSGNGNHCGKAACGDKPPVSCLCSVLTPCFYFCARG